MHPFEKSKENRYINVAIEFCKNFLRYIFSIKSLAVYTICFILWSALAFSGGLMSGTGAQTVVAVIGCAILALPVWLIMCTILHLYHVVKKFCNRAREKEKAKVNSAYAVEDVSENMVFDGSKIPDSELVWRIMDDAFTYKGISAYRLQKRYNLGSEKASEFIAFFESRGWIEPWTEVNHGNRDILISENDWKNICYYYRYYCTQRYERKNKEKGEHSEKQKTEPKTMLSRLDEMDGTQFEQFCAKILSNNGFQKVKITSTSGDYGIDILAEKDDITYGIQCKRYGGKVGNHAVQEALSGASYYHCMVAVVLTNNYFTPAAIETAQKTNVLLWDRDKLKILLDKMR